MTKTKQEVDLRKLPSVDALIQSREGGRLLGIYGRDLTVSAIREAVGNVRRKVGSEGGTVPLPEILMEDVTALLEDWTHPTLEPVINASGVIVHTNLGRAPLSEAALAAVQAVAAGYSTLEYDLEKGKRGSRYVHTEDLLVRLTGAEAGLVVNNNASALLLILSALSSRRRTLISRTQLIEIGGGFRIPDVMAQSGAVLHEIGTTNRVNIEDYHDAIEEHPIKLVLRAHRSRNPIIPAA